MQDIHVSKQLSLSNVMLNSFMSLSFILLMASLLCGRLIMAALGTKSPVSNSFIGITIAAIMLLFALITLSISTWLIFRFKLRPLFAPPFNIQFIVFLHITTIPLRNHPLFIKFSSDINRTFWFKYQGYFFYGTDPIFPLADPRVKCICPHRWFLFLLQELVDSLEPHALRQTYGQYCKIYKQ